MCVHSLRYLARNAHAPYCHLWPAPLCNIFLHCLINGMIFENVIEQNTRVFVFSTTFVWNISHCKKNWATYSMIKHYIDLHVKYALGLSDSNETWIFLPYFRKIFKYQISWQSVQWGPICSIRTDMKKLIVICRNFAKAPKKYGL